MRYVVKIALGAGVIVAGLAAAGTLRAQDAELAVAPDHVVVDRRPLLERVERMRDDLVVLDEHLPGRQTEAHDAVDRMRRELREIREALNAAPAGTLPDGSGSSSEPVVIAEEDFAELLASFKSATFTEPQIEVARQASRHGWFTTKQVVTLLGASFGDDGSIEVAALLYPRVVDRQRYHRVVDALKFGSSKERLRARLKEIDDRE